VLGNQVKAIGARKGWVRLLTEDLATNQRNADNAIKKKPVMMNDLVMS